VVAIAGCIAAISIPATTSMVDEFNLSGDAHGVSNSLALARMGAAANFTRARLYIDRVANSYRIERWNKTSSAWEATMGDAPLGSKNAFTSGAATAPPPNSQAVLGQPTACLDDGGVTIANTSCVLFNSRGIPIDTTGAPTPVAVIYVSGPTAVFGVVIGTTSQLAMWRMPPTGDGWVQK
jgi:Tfp pilus assembly protein FimT